MEKKNFKTLAEFIAELNALAEKYGKETPIFVYNEHLVDEIYTYEIFDLYTRPRLSYEQGEEEEIERGLPKNYIQLN